MLEIIGQLKVEYPKWFVDAFHADGDDCVFALLTHGDSWKLIRVEAAKIYKRFWQFNLVEVNAGGLYASDGRREFNEMVKAKYEVESPQK